MTFLIASVLACPDATELITKMQSYRISEETRAEMIQIVKDSTIECDWDANAD